MTKGQKMADKFLASLNNKTRKDALEYIERFSGLTGKERKNLCEYDLQSASDSPNI